jgi:hypothetical protein
MGEWGLRLRHACVHAFVVVVVVVPARVCAWAPLLSRAAPPTKKKVPVRDSRTVELTWQIPFAPHPTYTSKPASYLSHLLGHEGSGSVLSCLKQKGWANGLSAGQFSSASDFSIFGCQAKSPQGEGVLVSSRGFSELGLKLVCFLFFLPQTGETVR